MRKNLATAGLSVLLLLGACSGNDDKSDSKTEKPTAVEAAELLQKSADATLASTAFDIDYELSLALGPQDLTIEVDGIADYTNVVSDLEFNSVEQGRPSQALIKSDGTKVWVFTTGAVPEGKWAEGSADVLRNAGSFNTKGLLGALILLRAAEDVEVGSASEVDGEAGREYTTTINYNDAVAAAGSDAAAFQKSISLTGTAAATDLDVTVWIADSDSIVRDFSIEVEGSKAFPVTGDANLKLRNINDKPDSPQPPETSAIISGEEGNRLINQLIK